jgi:hypothetical protein
MELKNFGSIMGFAAELEAADRAFYETAATNPACVQFKDLLEAFAKDEKKNEKNMLRARREHVTEMVLEPIPDFTSEPFVSDRQVPLTRRGWKRLLNPDRSEPILPLFRPHSYR